MAVILVVGGARSGKSSFAEKLCRDSGESVCYIATSKITDDDMADRVAKHRAQRPAAWHTIERYDDFQSLVNVDVFKNYNVFLLDCITIMITNIMFDQSVDYDTCSAQTLDVIESTIFSEIKNLLDVMIKNNKTLIMVSNEVGMGIVPSYRLGSIFRDISGRVNQFLAGEADEVYNIICGLPQKLK
ncbi:MAG: bifunctional adenosylcobinamide kinase/adenosylcobinamide-phosphate guanylyltransferase [Clostridia bacterium]|nr:bifunctional adenosylcobinamide kinase/adenosylcobinamide-phosphate guanylyltransferase [Clostridia bacterium]